VAALKLTLARLLPGPWLFSDSTLYAREALAILARGWSSLREGAQEYTILYPLLLAPAFALPSRAEAHQAALALNAVISTSALFPIHAIARRMLPAGVSAVITAIVAFLPPIFVYALALSSENLFLPLFWWGTFLLLRLAERDSTPDAIGAGLLLGLLPAVKLTGFGVVAAAAALGVGMASFHRIDGRRAAVFLVALVAPQLVWVWLRTLIGAPERGLFGFGPGVGEDLVRGLAGLGREGWRPFLAYFLGETTYFLVGAYVAWVAFSLYLVTQYRTWKARSIEGFLLLWTFVAALALALLTVFLLYPISRSLTDPDQRGRAIYGRFIEVLIPAFFVLGTRGMIDFAWKERSPRSSRRELFLLLVTVLFTAMSFYPLSRYAVSSPFTHYALSWLGPRLSLVALLLLVLAPTLAGAAWLIGGGGRGRRAAVAPAVAGVLAMQALIFAVSIGGVVRGARARDATVFRIGHWLAGAGPDTRVAYDAGLGFGDQYFAYRFWSDATFRPTPPDRLLAGGSDFVVSRRRLPLPKLVQEANGVALYLTARAPERP
jgi:hypothetical protein